MMITAKEIKLKISGDITSEYIEKELKKQGFDVLRWAITDIADSMCTLNIAVVED